MSPLAVVVISAIFLGYVWYASRGYRERRAARRQAAALPELGATPGWSASAAPGAPVPAAPVAEGSSVRVVGIARAIQPLESPISGQQCVAYRVRVTVDRYEVPDAPPIDDAFTTQFMIERPGEPSVIVDGSHVRLDVRPQTRETYDGARAERFFQMRGLPIRAVLGSDIEEILVPVGARVMVAGSVLLDGAAAAPSGGVLHTGAGAVASHAYREGTPTTIRLAGNARHPLVISVVE